MIMFVQFLATKDQTPTQTFILPTSVNISVSIRLPITNDDLFVVISSLTILSCDGDINDETFVNHNIKSDCIPNCILFIILIISDYKFLYSRI